MSDEKRPQLPPELQPFTQTVEVAEGPNTDANAHQAKTAHAAPDGQVQFIVHDDGSKSIAFADTPQRREED